jgi:hypothetical protein
VNDPTFIAGTRHAGMAEIDLHLAAATVALGRGPLEDAARHIAAATELTANAADPQYTGPLAARTAELALWERRPLDALAAVEAGLERTGDDWFAAPLLALGVRAAADAGGSEATAAGLRLLAQRGRIDVGATAEDPAGGPAG